jgi:hypothetical protein
MNDNRVTQEEIDALLDSAETEEHTFWGKELVVSYRFPSRGGFTVSGRAPCVDPANFDLEIGRKVAREKVADQLWQLEGYRLQLELAAQPDWQPERMPPFESNPDWLERMQAGTTSPPLPSTSE